MLEQFDDDYRNAETQDRDDFKPVPDGTYQVYVDEVMLKKTKETQQPMLSWQFKIMAGKYEGRILFKNAVIMKDALVYIKTDLSVCGLELARFSDLPSHLSQLLNVKLEVKIVNKGENQRIYLQRKIETSADDMPTQDDIPF
jgi:hypothetical protein